MVLILIVAGFAVAVIVFLLVRPLGKRETVHLIARMMSETDFTNWDDMNRLLEDIKKLQLVEEARFADLDTGCAYVEVKFRGERGWERIGYDNRLR